VQPSNLITLHRTGNKSGQTLLVATTLMNILIATHKLDPIFLKLTDHNRYSGAVGIHTGRCWRVTIALRFANTLTTI